MYPIYGYKYTVLVITLFLSVTDFIFPFLREGFYNRIMERLHAENNLYNPDGDNDPFIPFPLIKN